MPLPDHQEYVKDAPEHLGGMLQPKQGGFRCPECGVDLSEQSPRLHALTHWPARWDPNNPPSIEAIKRRKQLESMEGQHEQRSEY